MSAEAFRAFLTLLMCADPNIPDVLMAWANEESKRHGFPDWIVAYHELRTP